MSERRVSASPEGELGPTAPPDRVSLGAFTVDLCARRLRRGAEVVPLPARAFDVLAYLIAHRGRAIDKDEIVAAVWRDVAVTDDSLIHAVSVLRRALGDDAAHPSFIETIPRRGYRFIDPADAAEAVEDGAAVGSPSVPEAGDAPPGAVLSAQAITWAGWVALAATGLLLLVVASSSLDRRPEGLAATGAAVRLQQPAPAGTTLASGGVVSPDGRHLAFVAQDDVSGRRTLWVRTLESADTRSVPGTDGASKPFWSPDGRSVAFFAHGRLTAADLSGGAPRTIAAIEVAPAGGSWGADDIILFANWTSGLYAVAATGGPVRRITRLDHGALDLAHAWPQFLPDGRRFLYQVVSLDASRTGVHVGSLDSAESDRLLDTASAAAYVPPGFLLYVQNDMLMAEPFDVSRLRLGGRPVRIARGVSASSLSEGTAISGSRDLLAFREGMPQQRLTWVDRSGGAQEALDVPTSLFNFRVSPDGRSLVASSSVTDAPGLWRVDLASRQATRLETDGIAPLWAPDGSRIAFAARAGLDVYVRGTAEEPAMRPIATGPSPKILNDWSPDAEAIVYTQLDPETKLDLWRLSLSDGTARPLLRTPDNEAQARISPDGRWIAYASDQSGTQEVYVRRYPQVDDPRTVSVGGGGQPQWRADQSELFYLSPDGALMAMEVTGTGRLAFGPPRRLFRTSMTGSPGDARDSYAVSADGRRFLIDSRRASGPPPSITLVVNWTAGLMPANARVLATDHDDRSVFAVAR